MDRDIENRLTGAMTHDRMETPVGTTRRRMQADFEPLPEGMVMKNQTSNPAAGMHAAAGVARLHAGFGICAYPWQVGTTAALVSMHNAVTTDSKIRHRWPQEPSP
jgi:hypothetical protein